MRCSWRSRRRAIARSSSSTDEDVDDAGRRRRSQSRAIPAAMRRHVAFLVVYLALVIYLVEKLAVLLDHGLDELGAPPAFGALIVAALVLAPEGLGGIQAALANRMQRAVNILLGSALATLALTIPAVVIIGFAHQTNVVLGLDPIEQAMLLLTLFVSTITYTSGQDQRAAGRRAHDAAPRLPDAHHLALTNAARSNVRFALQPSIHLDTRESLHSCDHLYCYPSFSLVLAVRRPPSPNRPQQPFFNVVTHRGERDGRRADRYADGDALRRGARARSGCARDARQRAPRGSAGARQEGAQGRNALRQLPDHAGVRPREPDHRLAHPRRHRARKPRLQGRVRARGSVAAGRSRWGR